MKLNIQLFAEGGWLTLSTKLDTKEFDNDIDALYRELQKKSDEQLEIKVDIRQAEKALETFTKMKEQLEQGLLSSEEVGEFMGMQVDEETFMKLSHLTNYFTDAKEVAGVLNKYIEQFGENILKDKDKLAMMKKELDEVRKKLSDAKKQDTGFPKMSFSVTDMIKKIAKWGLALLGIRSIYGLLSNAASQLSQTNEQSAKNLEYMKYSFAVALEPIITKLINMAKTLLTYINYISYKITGTAMFSKATADNFKKANTNAQKLKKTMASFDELSVVNGGTSGVTSNVNAPDFDLNDFSTIGEKAKERLDIIADGLSKIWEFLKKVWNWISEHKSGILAVLSAIVGYKIGAKVAELIKLISGGGGLTKALGAVGKGGLIGGLAALDAVLVTLAWKEMKETIKQAKDLEKTFKETDAMVKDYTKSVKELNNKASDMIDKGEITNEQLEIYNKHLFNEISQNKELIKQQKDNISNMGFLRIGYTQARNTINEYTEQIYENIKALMKQADNHTLTIDEVKELTDAIQNEIDRLEAENNTLDTSNERYKRNKEKIDDYKTSLENIQGTYKVEIQQDKTDKIDKFKTDFMNFVNGKYKLNVDANTNTAKSKIYDLLSSMGSKLFGYLFPGASTAVNAFSTLLSKFKVNKNAKGGVINLPGRGIEIGGEAGREGLVPLTDSQQMQLLGQEIGKWVNINLTNNTNLDGRTIARYTSKINQNRNFATNR